MLRWSLTELSTGTIHHPLQGEGEYRGGNISPTICCQNEIYVYEPNTIQPRAGRDEQDDKG